MSEHTLVQKLEYYGWKKPVDALVYKGLLLEALHEINRLSSLQAPVKCSHCKREIERAGDWYRCTDCDGYYHKGCMPLHARDWTPLHPSAREKS
jgi:tRNA(Ile2) C34 agmatinyltransferase TiaS